MSRIHRILFREGEERRGCGSGIFFIPDEDYRDLCIAHDMQQQVAESILESFGADLRFAFLAIVKSFSFILRGIKGMLFAVLVLAFSWIFFLLKNHRK